MTHQTQTSPRAGSGGAGDPAAGTGLTLVLGARGKTGRRVLTRLRDTGVATRAGSRAGDPPFDWADRGSWAPNLVGVSAVYVSFYPDVAAPGAPEAVAAFAAQAVAAGVRRLVLLSGRGEEAAQAAERAVMSAGIAEWTIVRCSWFNQNFSEGEFLDAVLADELALPVGEVGEPFVDADDIAEVAVAALTGDGHAGRVYELTGPRLLTFADAVREIAAAAGRPVTCASVAMAD